MIPCLVPISLLLGLLCHPFDVLASAVLMRRNLARLEGGILLSIVAVEASNSVGFAAGCAVVCCLAGFFLLFAAVAVLVVGKACTIS